MRTRTGLAAALAIGGALLAGGARADVVPGDKITDQNMDKVKDLISPGMEWCIKRGFPMTIVAPRRIEWPRAYKEATEKYSAQVKLAPDGLSVQNFIAGQPFPDLDPKDPQIEIVGRVELVLVVPHDLERDLRILRIQVRERLAGDEVLHAEAVGRELHLAGVLLGGLLVGLRPLDAPRLDDRHREAALDAPLHAG